MLKQPKISAIDLFCGAGGLTHGFEREKISVEVGIDIDPACEYPYNENNESKFWERSVAGLGAADVLHYFSDGHIKLIAGCAPCQPFSTYSHGSRRKKLKEKAEQPERAEKEDSESLQDEKWGLLYAFLNLVKEVKPELVTMENVLPLRHHKVFTDFVDELKKLGYFVKFHVVKCSDYGVPQKRTRLVLFASIYGEVEMCASFSDESKTVRDVIGEMPAIGAGGICEKDSLHRSRNLSPKNLERIIASSPGGTWSDWEESLVTECHKSKSGESYGGVYGRMEWSLAPTITTQFYGYGSGRFGHPVQNRAISLREGAILQTFPPTYSFVKKDKDISFDKIGRLIGNAVPVNLGRAIARSLKEHLEIHLDKVRING